MSSSDFALNRTPLVSILRIFARFRMEIRNWYSVGLLACLTLPTRFTRGGGFGGALLRNRAVTFRMRDGTRIRCRLKDAGDIFSVYVHQDYASYPILWEGLSTVIDIGATVGSFTLWAGKRAKDARLFAVEPNPEVGPFLQENINANGLSARARVLAVALGGASGYGTIVEGDYSTLATVNPQSHSKGARIPIVTLDGLLSEIGNHCDLLKLDCEGAEYDILLGCTEEAFRGVASILCEYHPIAGRSPQDLIDRLRHLNFKVSARGHPFGLLFATRR
jgi:FkbM family methyltransferase